MAYQPTAYPPPVPRKKHTGLIILFIVLGFIALLFVGCAAILAAGAHEAAKVVKSPEVNAPKKAYAMGQPAKDGKFTFVVTKVTNSRHIGDSLTGSDAQGRFVVVTVNVTNHGTKAQLFDASSQHLIAAGKTYDATENVFVDDKAFLNNINPGNGVKAQLAFDVPAGETGASIPKQVVLHDSPFSNGVRINLK